MILPSDFIEKSIWHHLRHKRQVTHSFRQIESLETVLSRRKIKGDYFCAYHAGDHAWLRAKDTDAVRYGWVEVSPYREIKLPRSLRFEFTVRITPRGRKALKVAEKFGSWCTERHRLHPQHTTARIHHVLYVQEAFREGWAKTMLSIKHCGLRRAQEEIVAEMLKRKTREDQFGSLLFLR